MTLVTLLTALLLCLAAPTGDDGVPPARPEAGPGGAGPVAPAWAARPAAPAPIAGVALPMHSKQPGRSYARELNEIRKLGAGWVELIVVTRQERVDSSEVPLVSDRTPRIADVEATIRRARALGLHVLVMPVVLVKKTGPDEWRGRLRPTDRDAWWRSYGAFVGSLVDAAQAGGAEAFCVGSELASLEHDSERWRALIGDVRTRFHGWLTYSANWDHFATIAFWDALDFASMTGYFTLSREDPPSDASLVEGWHTALSEMRRLAELSELPVIFTEVGVPSLAGAAAAPWDYTRQAPVDVELQRRAFEAFEDVFLPQGHRASGFHGLFLYDWWGRGGPQNGAYTARGKPAQRSWRRILVAVGGSV